MDERRITVGETQPHPTPAPTLTSRGSPPSTSTPDFQDPLIPTRYPDPHTDRSTALMEVAKRFPDLTVQGSVRDPEVTGEAVKLRVTSQLGSVTSL